MDLLKAIVPHLSSRLSVKVATERPENAPRNMVIVSRTGGGGSMFDDRASISVESWGESESAAYKLGMAASAAMFDLPASAVNVADVQEDTFYSATLPDGTRRWMGMYTVYTNR